MKYKGMHTPFPHQWFTGCGCISAFSQHSSWKVGKYFSLFIYFLFSIFFFLFQLYYIFFCFSFILFLTFFSLCLCTLECRCWKLYFDEFERICKHSWNSLSLSFHFMLSLNQEKKKTQMFQSFKKNLCGFLDSRKTISVNWI